MKFSVGDRVWLEGIAGMFSRAKVEVVGTLQNRPDWYNVRREPGGPIFAAHESRLTSEA